MSTTPLKKMGQCFFVPADVLTHNSLGKSGILFTWTETQGDGAELKVVSQCSQQAEFHNTPAEIFQLSWILQKPTLSAKESLKKKKIKISQYSSKLRTEGGTPYF